MADLTRLRIDTPADWRSASSEARAGNPYRLAYLVKHCRDSMPDDVAGDLADLIANPVPRKDRKQRALSRPACEQIRTCYLYLTKKQHGYALRPNGPEGAYAHLGEMFGQKIDTIRNVIERRGAYRDDPSWYEVEFKRTKKPRTKTPVG